VIYFREPQSYKERLGQEMTVNFLNDVILQDTSPLEGMQAMLNSRGIREFHANDEELLVRHLHKVVATIHPAKRKRSKNELNCPQFAQLAQWVPSGPSDGHRAM
jgi:hypothetical protein